MTGLPNLRGFAAIGEHYVRMADRLGQPGIFVFVRLDDHDEVLREEGPGAADELARDAAEVILEAVRDSDMPARIAPDTICVLLTGDAEGAESIVLSRLVEAIASQDAGRPAPARALARRRDRPLRTRFGRAARRDPVVRRQRSDESRAGWHAPIARRSRAHFDPPTLAPS